MENEQIYINVLMKTLEKKISLLEQLIDITKQQGMILEDPNEEVDMLDSTFDIKESMITEINELDGGFTSIYERVQEEIKENKHQYKEQIQVLKQQISRITDLSVKLSALEARNRPKFESYFLTKSNKIKEFRKTSHTATSYYKNMTQQQEGQSYFFDKKK